MVWRFAHELLELALFLAMSTKAHETRAEVASSWNNKEEGWVKQPRMWTTAQMLSSLVYDWGAVRWLNLPIVGSDFFWCLLPPRSGSGV